MTSTTKITIHRALAELKLIDAKIDSGITQIYPTGIHQKGKKIDGHITEEEFASNATSAFQSVSDLINRKIRIKSLIVESNSKTKVTVADKEMTVSDAITFKTIVEQKKKLSAFLQQKNSQAISALNRNNDVVSKNVEVLLQNAFSKDSTKISKEDSEAVSKPYKENNEWHLLDPLKVAERIAELNKEAAEFEADVDSVLSESNAVTFIEI